MLRLLTTRMRRRAGWWLALSYLVCVMTTPLSLSFAGAAAAAHCLLDEFHMVAPVPVLGEAAGHSHAAMMHDHAAMMHNHAATMHDHGKATHGVPPGPDPKPVSHDKSSPADCCGMFCMIAATAELGVAIGPAPHARAIVPMLETAPGGLGPHRIDRPPIVLASL
jgi:hypothetical protein